MQSSLDAFRRGETNTVRKRSEDEISTFAKQNIVAVLDESSSSGLRVILDEFVCGEYSVPECQTTLPLLTRWKKLSDEDLVAQVEKEILSTNQHFQRVLTTLARNIQSDISFTTIQQICCRHLEENTAESVKDLPALAMTARLQLLQSINVLNFLQIQPGEVRCRLAVLDTQFQRVKSAEKYVPLKLGKLARELWRAPKETITKTRILDIISPQIKELLSFITAAETSFESRLHSTVKDLDVYSEFHQLPDAYLNNVYDTQLFSDYTQRCLELYTPSIKLSSRSDVFKTAFLEVFKFEILRKEVRKSYYLQAAEKIIEQWGSSELKALFPAARKIRRELCMHIGPTNSGKTYHAFNEMSEATSGVYLAPLRLLALEGQDALAKRGIPASLLTGEECDIIEGSEITSSTIEMCDFSRPVDLAIIDEIQMIQDPQRGWAWVQALLGVPAKKIIMAGSEDAIPAIERLAEYLGEEVSVKRYTRMNELKVNDATTELTKISDGTAVIAFSRREVLDLKALLEESGKSVAVIYGALGPEVRREEARRFRDGEVNCLVATDAIGMGLNLPIREILFWTTSKFNGSEVVPLTTSQVKQIAGRAGRYGFHEAGKVGAITVESLEFLRTHLSSDIPEAPEQTLTSRPSFSVIQLLSDTFLTENLSEIVAIFDGFLSHESRFCVGDLESFHFLANITNSAAKAELETKFLFAIAPFNTRSVELMARWSSWFFSTVKCQPCDIAGLIRTEFRTLEFAETIYDVCTLYLWLSKHFPSSFRNVYEIRQTARDATTFISKQLNSKQLFRTCKKCGERLDITCPFRICDRCKAA